MLKVHNWERFQHYKHRNPPWIKLHRGLLDNQDFMGLPLASMALAPCIWLLASERAGDIPDTVSELAFRLRRPEAQVKEVVQTLIDKRFLEGRLRDASTPLAGRVQDACLETETETETETEKRKTEYVESSLHLREVFDYWASRTGQEGAQWSPRRKGILEVRFREEKGKKAERVAALKQAVDGALLDPFYNGTETGRTYLDFDNIFRNKGRDRIEKLQRVAREASPKSEAQAPAAELPAQDSTAIEKWTAVKEALKASIPPHLFRTWFSPTFGWGWTLDEKHPENGYPVMVVTVPSTQHRKTLQEVYGKQIKAALKRQEVELLQLHVRAFE